MLIRVIFLLFLASNLFAGDLVDNWTPGKTEKMTYEIKTIVPKETINYNNVVISRPADNKDILNIKQTLDISNQSIKIVSEENYSFKDLRLISSINHFFMPPMAIERLGTDSLIVKATRKGDSLFITTNSDKVPPGSMPFIGEMTTTTGSQLFVRNMNFTVGKSYKYGYINLLRITGQSFQIMEVIDSVISQEKITTPMGTYDCYKVLNTVPGALGYSYYTTDARHIPVLIELLNPETKEQVMTLTLQKYE
ncbi:MAG: hypothetical protein CVT49_05745 [candidate division Zixibacteria bacterium HGW-Zixibacteria-1]|nr:MAG: hypothetical protein CVT49_05745 [candidate division Zixibacteria bacterium HGW-Zixibacteria-1]